MGFMDKAKALAEQAQAKADELQKQFNEKQAGGAAATTGGPITEYDKHGRPQAADPAPPHGDPLAGSVPPPVAAPAQAPVASEPPKPHGDPADAMPKAPKPPSGGGMSSGDPLAG